MIKLIGSTFSLTLFLTTFGCLIPLSANAQITADGTTSTIVNQNGNDFTIEQGSRVGDNLFHSFEDFSVPTLGSAVFDNPSDVANIFSRVTGSNISNIDGLLGANGTANLYLINPNGIIFGENVRLNLGGSFFASTADSVLFEGNTEFSAINPQSPPLLEVNIPIGLNFRDNTATITVRGNGNGARNLDSAVIDTQEALRVSSNATFGLVGGHLNFEDAVVKTAGGRIELGSVTEGQVNFIPVDNGLNFDYSSVKNFSDISLSGRSSVDASGIGGGDIQVSGKNISITGVSEFSANTLGSENGGDIEIFASESLEISGVENEFNFISAISNRIFSDGKADVGDINIETGILQLGNRAAIGTVVSGQGNAGDININVRDSLVLESQGNTSIIASNVEVNGIGNGGNINISTGSLTFRNGALLNANISGKGNAGDITLAVAEDIIFQGFRTGIRSEINNTGIGNGGDINITAQNLTIRDSAQVTNRISGIGNSGNINININDTVSIVEGSSIVNPSIIDSTAIDAQGSSGNINIDTRNLLVINNAELTTLSLIDGNIGNITIKATDNILIGKNGTIQAESDFGINNAGNIEIETSQILLFDDGKISTSAIGGGVAGNITITTDFLELKDRSFIDAFPFGSTGIGKGGDITINARKLIVSDESQISVVSQGRGNSGNITIRATELVKLSGAAERFRGGLIASAIGSGKGGDIKVFTDELFISNGATIIAGNSPSFSDNSIFAVGTGQPGNINIETNSIRIENTGRIEAVTQSEIGNSANITLKNRNDIILFDNSFISARALNNAKGGNLTIDTEFIIAFPNQNNDIIANANQGDGGEINITAQSLFGIEERPLNPLTNDINVSSEFGLQGITSINTPNLDPTSSLIELPDAVGDASDQVSQNPCEQGVGSEFIVTGKGGLPPNPNETLNSNRVRVSLVDSVPLNQQEEISNISPENSTAPEAIPAQGWIFNDKGEVMLTSYKTTNTKTKRSQQRISNSCAAF